MWPNDIVHVYSKSIQGDVGRAVLDNAEDLAYRPNYWIPKEQILQDRREIGQSAVETAIQSLYHRIMAPMLSNEFSGAEWWVQVYEPGRGLAFHFDKDEEMFKDRKHMDHPVWSSIVYLTGSTAGQPLEANCLHRMQIRPDLEGTISFSFGSLSNSDYQEFLIPSNLSSLHCKFFFEGGQCASLVWVELYHVQLKPKTVQALLKNVLKGPTVVIDQRFDSKTGASHPSEPSRSVLVWPQANTFAVFDGGLAHGVLDSASQEARVTLLVNWWTKQPQAVHPAPPDVYHSPPSVSQASDSACNAASGSTSNLHQSEGGCSTKKNSSCIDSRMHHHERGSSAAERSKTVEHDEACLQQTCLPLQGREVEEATNGVSLLSLQPGIRPHDLDSVENGVQEAKRECISSLAVPGDSQDVVTVDDLLESNGLDSSRCVAVSIEHTGYQLYPVDAADKDQIQFLKTAAALVPAHLLESDSE